jgi:lipopolysaccharide biosynthesis glycosyltransferase
MNQDKHLEVAVVYTIDEKFIPHFTTSATSLLSYNASSIRTIYLVVNFEPNKKLTKAINFLKSEFLIEMIVLEVKKTDISHLKISKGDHVTQITYARLLISKILPPNVEKVLYLDSDTVVIQSLNELFTQSFENKYLMAVNELDWGADGGPGSLREKNLIGEDYFNAGVMLIDLKRWRDESIADRLLEIAIKYHQELTYWDQDVLNIVFKDKWKDVDKSFNAFRLVNIVYPRPAVIHYAGVIKPWHLFSNHPYRMEYKSYRKKTPFRLVPSKSQSLFSLIGLMLSQNLQTNKIVSIKHKLEFFLRNPN